MNAPARVAAWLGRVGLTVAVLGLAAGVAGSLLPRVPVVGVAVGFVAPVLSVVDVVQLVSPLSPPPQPTANTRSVAPPNTASRVLGWDFMVHQSVAGCPADTRAAAARNSLELRRRAVGVGRRMVSV